MADAKLVATIPTEPARVATSVQDIVRLDGRTATVRSPPNSWGGLGPRSHQKTIDACDAHHDRWMASKKGREYLAWDRRVVDLANAREIGYRDAMEALRVEFV